MKKASRIATILVVSIMILGIVQIQPVYNDNQMTTMRPHSDYDPILSLYNSQNITVQDVTPTNDSTVLGSLDINFNLTSDYSSLNLTIYINNKIYPDYNLTIVTDGVQLATIDTTKVFEGLANFTLLFEYINQTYDRESVYLRYIVDNDGESITADVISPAVDSKLSGLAALNLNISSNYGALNLTIFANDEVFSPYQQYLINPGVRVLGISTNNIREGILNLTLHFWYNSSGTYDEKTYYLNYIVDNDGEPITTTLISPSPGSIVSGNATFTFEIGSEYVPLTTTLYIEGLLTEIDGIVSNNGINEYTVETLPYEEGLNNFTFLFAFNSSLSERLVFEFIIDNHGFPLVSIISPEVNGRFTGLDDFTVNITSTYSQVYANVTVDDTPTPEYNETLIDTGITVLSINGSRYENGIHTISVTVWTEEGLTYIASDSRTFNFLDHIRFYIIGLSQHARVSGDQEIEIQVETPYTDATLNVYEYGELISELTDVALVEGSNFIYLNVTGSSEGEHNYTFIVSDDFGHKWTYLLTLIVDNHGLPSARITSPREDIVIGTVTFVVDVETTWDYIYMSVYVDDELVEGLNNITVTNGDNSFSLDVGAFSKWQHVIRLDFETPEGLELSIEEIYGFASIRIEEILSLAILLAIAFLIPLIRMRQGQPIKPILMMDIIFLGLAAALFFIIGVSSIPTAIWHFNLTSIWTIGVLLIFVNWVYPLLSTLGEEE